MTRLKPLTHFKIFFAFTLVILACGSSKNINSPTLEKKNTGNQVQVAENERGVLFRRFQRGVDTSEVYLPGQYSISPFDRFFVYNIDSQSDTDLVEITSKDGINIQLDIAYTFSPIPDKVALLHSYIGSNYPERIVREGIDKVVKQFFKNYTSADISLQKKLKFESQLSETIKVELEKGYVELQSFQINTISNK